MPPIDPTKPADGVAADKGDLRANLSAAKDGIEADIQSNSSTAITVNAVSFGDHQFIRVLCKATGAIAVTLANNVPKGKAVELVRKGAGNITAQPASGAALEPAAGSGNWLAGIHSTTDLNEALVYTVDELFTPVAALNAAQSWAANNQSYSISAGSDRLLVVGVQHEGTITPDSVSVTYGGQAMTRRVFEHVEAGVADLEVVLFTLGEAGIAAASGTTIAVTGQVASFTLHARSYQNVDQTGPILTTGSGETDVSTPNPLTIPVGARAGTAIVALAGSNAQTTADWTASGLTERTDQQFSTSTTGSMADGLFAAAQSVTVGCQWGSQSRAAVAAIVLAPGTSAGTNSSWRLAARP